MLKVRLLWKGKCRKEKEKKKRKKLKEGLGIIALQEWDKFTSWMTVIPQTNSKPVETGGKYITLTHFSRSWLTFRS